MSGVAQWNQEERRANAHSGGGGKGQSWREREGKTGTTVETVSVELDGSIAE